MRRVYLLFFVSGAAGLIYQVAWSRIFEGVFGVSVYAITTVLAVFLSGLALGGIVLGRRVDRSDDPLRFYGFLELGVALTAVLGFFIVRLLTPLHLWVANRLEPDSPGVIAVRAAIAAIVILPPTFLMGGTLPAMTRVVVRGLERFGRGLSLIYALNTLGAVAGCLAAGFWLIGHVGLHATLGIAVGVNAAVGIVSLALSSGGRFRTIRDETAVGSERGTTGATSSANGLLLVIAASGFVTLGLEILWTRALVTILGTTTYAFSTMLASFLTGIGLGALVARRFIDRAHRLRAAFGWVQLAIAGSTLVTLPLIGSAMARDWMTGRGDQWLAILGLRFGISFLVMLVPAFFIGTTFPLAARIWTRDMRRLAGDVGAVYGCNTLGDIAGAVVVGFLVLPAVGLQRGIVLLACLSLVNAAWGFFGDTRAGWRWAALASAASPCLPLLLIWHPAPLPSLFERPDDRTLYYREGITATVKVLRPADAPDLLRMTVDGITIGQSLVGVDAKQQTLAHLPFLLRPDAPPRRLLSIGLGTGILAGEIARYPSVDALDVLEISPTVIEAAAVFARYNHGVLDNPKVRVIADDGVNFLRRTDQTYDAIVSDAKSRNRHAANATFFSTDYYSLCRRHLDAGGLMIQWIPLDIPARELATILRSFASVFPRVHMLVGAPRAGFLVGGTDPLVLDLDHIGRLLAGPLGDGMRRHGVREPYRLLAFLVADETSLEPWLSAESTLNTLERPVLEFYSPREHAVPSGVRNDENLLHLLGAWSVDASIRGADPAVLSRWNEAAALLTTALEATDEGAAPEEIVAPAAEAIRLSFDHAVLGFTAAAVLQRAVKRQPDDVQLRLELAAQLDRLGDAHAALEQYRQAAVRHTTDGGVQETVGLRLMATGNTEEAMVHLEEALRLEPDRILALAATAEFYASRPDADSRDPQKAIQRAERAAQLSGRRDPLVLGTLATVYASVGDIRGAIAATEEALGIARGDGNPQLIRRIEQQLEAFRQGRVKPGNERRSASP